MICKGKENYGDIYILYHALLREFDIVPCQLLILEIVSKAATALDLTGTITRQTDIADILDLSPSTISEHIKLLRKKQLIVLDELKTTSLFEHEKLRRKQSYFANPKLNPNHFTVFASDFFRLLKKQVSHETGHAFTFEKYFFLHSIYYFTRKAKKIGWRKNLSAMGTELNINRETVRGYVSVFTEVEYLQIIKGKYQVTDKIIDDFDCLHTINARRYY